MLGRVWLSDRQLAVWAVKVEREEETQIWPSHG